MTTEELENRWSERQGIKLGITLIDDGQEVLHATSKDISIGGILIDTSSIDLSPNLLDIDKTFSLSFTLRSASGEQRHSLPARVTRHQNGSTALAFSDYDIHTLNALRVILYDGSGLH